MDSFAIFSAQYLYFASILLGIIFFFLQPGARKKALAISSLIIAPLSFLISRIAAMAYYDPRPFVVGHFTPLIAHAADNGFPSDHVLLTGAIATIIWFFNKKWSAILWILALVIGWARIYTGIHHPLDIAGSIVIVIISGMVYWTVHPRGKNLNE